ncbi:MAG: threonine synthase [Ignavibacteriaceae bacterium]|nr:threonine synthase [Ignavibacteriaceae bacterium]
MPKSGFKYKCKDCGKIFEISSKLMLCPYCKEESLEGKPLKGVLEVVLPSFLRNLKREFADFDIYDYLPIERGYFPSIPVGNTPLIKSENLNSKTGYNDLYLKFDGTNPTGSYKDRASFLVSAFAKKFGLDEIVLASTGNAASSMAGIGAAAGQKIFIFMPSTAPKAKLIQCLQYGATLIPIKGNYDKAFDLSLQFSEITGYLNRNTAYNPMTIEGKKTSSFEITAQLKKNADYVFVPVGDGVVLSGVIKGFNDLKFLGLINRVPKIIGVQSDKSKFIYEAFKNGNYDLSYKATTIADSISVDVARNGYGAVYDLRNVNGDIITVSDEEILSAQRYISMNTGIFCEPSSAAAAAGFLKTKDYMQRESTVVILLSGHGLKDIESASKIVDLPETYEPDINQIIKKLKK